MKKEITVTYSQTIRVEVDTTDSVDTVLDKVKDAVSAQHYPTPYEHKYLEFIVDTCPEMPSIEEEMLD